jgi:hypothetical protein
MEFAMHMAELRLAVDRRALCANSLDVARKHARRPPVAAASARNGTGPAD